MKRLYAEVVNGLVRSIHIREDDRVPDFHPQSGLTLVEVTSAEPMPSQEWKYDSKTGLFSEPDPPDPQVAVENKIQAEMRSAESRGNAIQRLKATGKLAQDYEE